MCPDIETYAPLIHAAFDVEPDPEEAAGERADLRVRLADRAHPSGQPDPRGRLQARRDGRGKDERDPTSWTSPACEPVRRKFGFDEDDRSRLEGWVVESGIRWGLDSEYREQFQLGGLALEHVALGARPDPPRGPDGGGTAEDVQRGPPLRRHVERGHRAGGQARGVRGPSGLRSGGARRPAADRGLDQGDRVLRRRPHVGVRRKRVAARGS